MLSPATPQATITVMAIDDRLPEPKQNHTITLEEITEGFAQIGAPKQTTITIPTNDTPTISITPPEITLEEGQTAELIVTVNLDPIDTIILSIINLSLTNFDGEQVMQIISTDTTVRLSPTMTSGDSKD